MLRILNVYHQDVGEPKCYFNLTGAGVEDNGSVVLCESTNQPGGSDACSSRAVVEEFSDGEMKCM